jgi:hypothetical protein
MRGLLLLICRIVSIGRISAGKPAAVHSGLVTADVFHEGNTMVCATDDGLREAIIPSSSCLVRNCVGAGIHTARNFVSAGVEAFIHLSGEG